VAEAEQADGLARHLVMHPRGGRRRYRPVALAQAAVRVVERNVRARIAPMTYSVIACAWPKQLQTTAEPGIAARSTAS
jgi:hypothetical protein